MNFAHTCFSRAQPNIALVRLAFLLLTLPMEARAQSVENAVSRNQTAAIEDLKKNWAGFRGFGSNGHATDATPPLTWSVKSGKNILWKTPIAKHGMSSPVVWAKHILLTGADEESRDIYCFDTETGTLLWKHAVDDLPGSPPDGTASAACWMKRDMRHPPWQPTVVWQQPSSRLENLFV